MGRCYEFATQIVDECDHAMVVSAVGGACECPTCGARCEGRFAGCAQILEQPGYVPTGAPGWAIERRDPPVVRPEPVHFSEPRRSEPRARDAERLDDQTRDVVALFADLRRELRQLLDESVTTALERSAPRAADRTARVVSQHIRELRTDVTWAMDEARRELDDTSKRQLAALDALNERMTDLASRIEAQDRTLLQVVEGLQRMARRVTRLEKVLTQYG